VEPAHLAVVAAGTVLNRHPSAAEHLDTSALRERLDRLRVGSPQSSKDFHLLHAVELRTDALRCLWGGDRGVALAPLCEADDAAEFSPPANVERINGLLTVLEATPEGAAHCSRRRRGRRRPAETDSAPAAVIEPRHGASPRDIRAVWRCHL
jgi:hypothetical protein